MSLTLQTQLDKVYNILFEFLQTGNRLLDGSLDEIKKAKGKLLRPMMYLLSAKHSGQKEDLRIAAALEMLHIGTLIHDDIIDEAKLRRKHPSIQSRYGKEYAVYMGDYLFSNLFLLLSDTDMNKEDVKNLAKAMTQICQAEMKQYHFRYDTSIRKRDYLSIISGKTAALFSFALGLGASEDERDLFYKIGYHIGMAFQLQDDILDFTGDEQVVGKDLRKDILMGYYQMPIILSMEQNHIVRNELSKQDIDVDTIIHQVIYDGSIDKTKELVKENFEQSQILFSQSHESKYKQDLKELFSNIEKRNN